MSELMPCPFCGWQPEEVKWREIGKKTREYSLYYCPNEECPSYFTKPGSMTAEDWNNRPIEDALQERNAELESERDEARAMVEKFIGLGSTLIDATSVAVHPKECEEWFDATDEWYGAQQ
jgi:hypothetical protein